MFDAAARRRSSAGQLVACGRTRRLRAEGGRRRAGFPSCLSAYTVDRIAPSATAPSLFHWTEGASSSRPGPRAPLTDKERWIAAK